MLTNEEKYIGKNLIIQFLFILIISILFIPTVKADSTLIPSSNIDQVYYYPYDGDTIGQVVLSGYNNYFILSSSDGYPTGSYLATEMIWFKGLTFVQDKEYTFYITYGFNNNTQNCYTQSIINNWSTIRSLKAVVGSSTNWGNNISFYDTTVSTTGDLCGAGTITIKFILTSAIDFNGLRIGWGDTSNYSQLSPMLSGTYDTFSIWLKEIRYSSEQDISDSLSGVEEKLNEQNNKTDELIGEQKETNQKLDEAEETRQGIWETIKDLPNKFLEMLKSLFIPDDGYFEEWFNDLKTFFEEKLGFLSTPITIFIDFVNRYLELDSSTDIIINIPDITVPNFEDHKIISATVFNWSETLRSKESLNTLWQLYLAFIDVYLILNFINLCENKYNRIFGGEVANYEYYTVEDSYTYDNNTGEVLSSRRNERTTTRKKVDN